MRNQRRGHAPRSATRRITKSLVWLLAALSAVGCEPPRPPVGEYATPAVAPSPTDAERLRTQGALPDSLIGRWFRKEPWGSGPYQPFQYYLMHLQADGVLTEIQSYMPQGDDTRREVWEPHMSSRTGRWAVVSRAGQPELCLAFGADLMRCFNTRQQVIYDQAVENPNYRRVMQIGSELWKEDKSGS